MSNDERQPVAPVRPVAPWIGGKRNLAGRITPLIDQTHHRVYCEPFVGMGGIFFRRTVRPRAEVINDLGRDVANLFRILQRHYPQFLEVMRFQLTTRAEFERLVQTVPETLTDLERAARFLYLQRTAFGGKVTGRNFGVSKDREARFNLTTLEPMLEDVHARLSGVTIECLDVIECIRRYDSPATLFYLDPPYCGSEDDYGEGMFSSEVFAAMVDELRAIQGQFIMSINDRPDVRKACAGFDVVPVSTTYSVAAGTATSARELIVSSVGLVTDVEG